MKIQKRESNKNLKTYLAKELNISLSESELICKVIKEYKQEKKQHLEEIDVKKAMVTGALGLASILHSDKLDASSDYFTMQKTNLNAIESKVKGLSIPEQIKVYEDTLKLLPMGDNTTKNRITNILGELRAKLKQDRLSRGIYTRESKIKRRQELEEVSWKDVKDFGKKAIATTLLLSASFMPIAQSLYGNDSCSIDSSGEVVSCDASKLQSKKSVKELLSVVKLGMNLIQKNINTPNYKYHEFTPDEIQAVKNRLNELLDRPNINEKEKDAVNNELIKIAKLEKKFNSIKK